MSKLQSLDDVIALAGDEQPVLEDRVQRAAIALAAYVKVYGQDIIDTAITDLIADLLHLADASELTEFYGNPYDLVDRAMGHYEAERGDGELD